MTTFDLRLAIDIWAAEADYSLTHMLTHTGIAWDGHGSLEWTVTTGFSVKKGQKPYNCNGKYRFQQLITRRS